MDHQPDTVRPVLLLLAQVAATQPQLTTLSEKALKALLATPQLTNELAALKASHVRLSPLLRVITNSLVARLSASAPEAVDAFEAPLVELIQSEILEQVAQGLALQVLQAAAEPGIPAEVQAAFQRALRALDVRHPAAVDAAVNGALAPLRAQKAGCGKRGEHGSSSEGEEAEEGSASARQRAIFAVVQSTFGGSAAQGSTRALCGDTPLTLSAAAASPAAGVRRMVLQASAPPDQCAVLELATARQVHNRAMRKVIHATSMPVLCAR
ncbi:hypothetical protein DUNSADRAFT_16592 [Dunaliella salina]|uniref:Uncharacterized protein n=1 Tax=Dunaliella salina TaxID=3046 RepID=A0ABQ7H0X7_DUNSA|nr:hypothetical protein DUNSADRAFT_16592 [Dunaliella salina]|eukprot:KAF5840501.1 hypothetical protein DUNSADRAFT_16592 [Dunaliella salina]